MNRLRALQKFVRPSLPSLGHWAAGIAMGTLFLTIFSRLRLAFGASTDVTIAVLLTFVLASLASISFIRNSSRLVTLAAFWVIAIWTVLQPAVLDISLNSIHQFSLMQLTSHATRFGITFAIVIASLFPFAFGTVAILLQPTQRRSALVGGIATSLFLVPTLLGLSISPNVAMWLAVSGAVLSGAYAYLNGSRPGASGEFVSSEGNHKHWIEKITLSFMIGFAFAIATFVGQQLILKNLVAELATIGGLLAGLACGSLLSKKFKTRIPWSESLRWMSLAAWGAIIVLSYPTMTYLALHETIWISNTFLLFISRAALLTVLTLPLGIILRTSSSRQTLNSADYFAKILGFTSGFTIAIWSGISPALAVVSLVLAASAIAAFSFWKSDVKLPVLWSRRFVLAAVVGVIVCGFLFRHRLDPSKSEKLVFSGNAFAAVRNGVDWSTLQWMDDGRLANEYSTLEGRLSFWKQRGSQALVRENGLVTEIRSTNSAVFPMNASEVIPGLFPLIAHPTAEHVLVLGMHSTTLHTCESYPLHSVTVIEDSSFFDEIQSWATSFLSETSQFRFINADLRMALKASHTQPYDVIIAPQVASATTAGASELTQEFYLDSRRLLAPGGIFCQRLPYYDLGPETVREIAATLKSVYPQVLVVGSVQGETLLVGSLQSEPLVTKELVGRMQLPQARYLLSELGWDWSIPASQGALDDSAVTKWIAETHTPFSSRHHDLLFKLPAEVARWATKSQLTASELAKQGMALGGYLGEGDESLDISQRLEDSTIAQKILNEHPDDIWSYRAALKEQLSKRPRAKIMQVKHEGLARRLHPDDQRRKAYLVTLSKLAKSETPTLQMVDSLVQFRQPFDPLMGTFVSYEAVHQLRRVDKKNRGDAEAKSAELNHLLYSIYFSSAGDKSVRNVCEAILILHEHPEVTSSDEDRWDQLNGLVEILRHRWYLRLHDKTRQSKYETIDTERSIGAVRKAINDLEELASRANVSESDWQIRSEFIQENLSRPLKQHRSKQLRRYQINPQVQ